MPVSIPVSEWTRSVAASTVATASSTRSMQSQYANVGTVGAQETRGFVRFFDETGGVQPGYHYNCNGESYFYVGSVAGQSMSQLLDGTWKQPYINTTNPNPSDAAMVEGAVAADVIEDGCEV